MRGRSRGCAHPPERVTSRQAAVAQGQANVPLIDPGYKAPKWPASRTTLASWASPLWQASRRISDWDHGALGTPSSAKRPAMVKAAAQLICEICRRTRTGRPASPRGYRRKSPRRYRWIC